MAKKVTAKKAAATKAEVKKRPGMVKRVAAEGAAKKKAVTKKAAAKKTGQKLADEIARKIAAHEKRGPRKLKTKKPEGWPKGLRHGANRQIPVSMLPAPREEKIPVLRSEDGCRRYLESVRWPQGVRCPRCGGKSTWEIVERDQRECEACRYQFSVTAGTAFGGSHVPLLKWLECVKLQCREPQGLSARRMEEKLGVTYKTAWYLCHRVRAAMGAAAARRLATWETAKPASGAALLDEGVKATWVAVSDRHRAA